MRVLFTFIIYSSFLLILNAQTQTFTSSGSFTVPSGVIEIFVEAWGAGGAGGSAVGTGATTSYRAQAGGGGGGAYSSGTIMVTPGQVINYIVAPNTGANSGTNPLNGGDSSFGSVTAAGGQGGECVNAGTAGGHVGGNGGVGGTGTFNGGNGASRVGYSGSTTPGTSAGGGGGAGNAQNGSDANSTTNAGGTGGTANGGNGANGPSSGNPGGQGSIRGGGGAGAWAAASVTFRNGGAGNRGEIRLNYAPLPIKIKSFEVFRTEIGSTIKLVTASETNNDYFTIERSGDWINFDAIGEIDGAGNSSEERHYEFTDDNPLKGLNYYRIKQTDYDGQYSYSEVRSVVHDRGQRISISPKQTEGLLQISTGMEDYVVQVYSSAGQEVARYKGLSGHQTIDIGSMRSGFYIVKVKNGTQSETIKIVKY
jgi:hypothetical protein